MHSISIIPGTQTSQLLRLFTKRNQCRLDPAVLKQKVEETYGETVAGVFPLSEDLVQLASEGVFCVRYPEHAISHEFRKVA